MGRVKQLKPFVKVYVGLILAFFVSMALVFCIPDSWIQDNVNSSIEIMDGEGSYPMYFFYRHNSIMDVHTEGVMYNGLIPNRDYNPIQASTNDYKIPQNVVAVCDLLPGNVHALVSNRLIPYIRLYDPSITLEFGRNALAYNGIENPTGNQILYAEAQKEEIDVPALAPLAKEEGCTFLVFSNSRTYSDDWEAYGYKEYGHTDEFTIFVDTDYEEGQNTKKWEE